MGRCILCGKGRLFSLFTRRRICHLCLISLDSARDRLMSSLRDPKLLSESSGKFQTRLSQCDSIIKHAQTLLEYEEKGIRTTTPSPSEIITSYGQVRGEILVQQMRAEVQELLDRAKQQGVLEDPIAIADEALLKIYAVRKEVGETPQLSELETLVIRFIHECQWRSRFEKARHAEERGHTGEALKHYRKALHMLQTGEMDSSLRQSRFSEIVKKIKELKD
jgi:hypothetical protein